MFRLIFTAGMTLLTGYFFWRFWLAFRGLGRWHLLVAGMLAVLAANRYVARPLSRQGWETLGEAVGLVGVLWLVLLFWFLVVGVALNLWNLLATGLSGRPWPAAGSLVLAPRTSFFLTVALVLAAGVWGWFEARRIRVHHVEIPVAHLPSGMETFSIAQVSDLHAGSPQSRQRLAATARLLRELQPDLLVSTGDLVDGRFETINHLADELAAVKPPFGKYAIYGNHEFYAGVEHSALFHAAAGFDRVLRGECISPAEGLVLVGVDDPAVGFRGGYADGAKELSLLESVDRSATVILLKHRPEVLFSEPATVGLYDLQLSGHTHGGQVFPFGFLVRLVYRHGPGLWRLSDRSQLFVSRGAGTWGPPLRLMSPPEVVLVTLKKAAAVP